MAALLYIHGFLSSPQSAKARCLIDAMASRTDVVLHIPALPVDPIAAMAVLESIINDCAEPPGLIGSSLGGFYANILAARYGLKAALINPAVHPHELLAAYVGEQRNYHTGVVAEVKAEHFAFLQAIETKPPRPQAMMVLLETGDETLDYRHAEAFYAGCHLHITQGGSHSYEGFAEKLPEILTFLYQ